MARITFMRGKNGYIFCIFVKLMVLKRCAMAQICLQIASLSLKMINGCLHRSTLSLSFETELPQIVIHHLETEYVDKEYVHNELICVYLLCIPAEIVGADVFLLHPA